MCKWTTRLHYVLLLVNLIRIPENAFAIRCSRYPANTYSLKSTVDENFVIWATGNPQTYILGQSYNISLQAYNGRRFIGASIVLENDNGDIVVNNELGRLEVTDPVETRYSADCSNMIETTNTNPKSRIDLAWVAPLKGGFGCVLIRATVLQHRDVWFMDDGQLTKRICEEPSDEVVGQRKDDVEKQCCACDEARYEITFESNWSRNTHPKDFPAKGWLTRFSDILGAAHTSDYRFWDSGVLATSELKEFAEHGSSRGLERELNQAFKERKIRTILKARGPAFPYMNTPTIASIRVDPTRHQLSIASKIVPSPDWIVGVSGLELCLPNCTWIAEKSVSLYPWDIGTDAGPSYTSPDQPQLPSDIIRRMRSDFPSDPRSPFYDETGSDMKPLALLTIKRLRLYERKCEDEESNNPEDRPRECYTHPWSAWSECSNICGIGESFRSRFYKQPEVAEIYNCDKVTERRQTRTCEGSCPKRKEMWGVERTDEDDNVLQSIEQYKKSVTMNIDCPTTEWSQWSPCNTTCGAGSQIRTRKFLNRNPEATRECQNELVEYKDCFVNNVSCRGLKSPLFGDTDNNNRNYYEQNFDADEENQSEENFMFNQFNTYNGQGRGEEQYIGGGYGVTNRDYYPENPLANDFNNNESQLSAYIPAENLRQEQTYEDHIAPESRHGIRNGNFQYLRGPGNDVTLPTPAYQRFAGNIDKVQSHHDIDDDLFDKPPSRCYQPLTTVECSDGRVIGNFWFYNFCTDQCMLYAADICDRNTNKFPSLQKCEQQCAIPMRSSPAFLRLKQEQSPHCNKQRRANNRKWKGYIV